VTYKQIEYETHGKIAIVRTNRPEYRNAQSRILLEEMDDAFIKAERDPAIHVVILQGAGEHFSAGHDLGTPEQQADLEERPYAPGTFGHLQMTWDLFVDASLRWRDLKKPTIAQVQGYCIFGGYLIASCMDLIVASNDALFLPSHLQLFTAPWDLGIRKAKGILFENRFIPATEAYELGFVHKVVPREDLAAETLAQAERIAQNDLLTLRMLKQSINGAQDAMGYRTSVHSAHSNYMVAISGREPRSEDSRQLDGVGAALKKLKQEED
jgi:enoyl-CoA hydratase